VKTRTRRRGTGWMQGMRLYTDVGDVMREARDRAAAVEREAQRARTVAAMRLVAAAGPSGRTAAALPGA
jgi:hypothetical protein